MSIANDAIAQAKSVAPIFIVVYAILSGLLFFVAIVSARYDIPVAHFTRDPAAILNAHPFTGVISNIGILFWCSTFAICLFTSAIHFKNGRIIVAKFLLFSSLLTAVLLLDDLFMFHEFIFPKTLHIPEKLVYAGYFILVVTYFVNQRIAILETEYVILFVACAFLSLSVICDVLLPQKGMEFLIEDGFKLFGVVTWAIYFTRTCFAKTQEIAVA